MEQYNNILKIITLNIEGSTCIKNENNILNSTEWLEIIIKSIYDNIDKLCNYILKMEILYKNKDKTKNIKQKLKYLLNNKLFNKFFLYHNNKYVYCLFNLEELYFCSKEQDKYNSENINNTIHNKVKIDDDYYIDILKDNYICIKLPDFIIDLSKHPYLISQMYNIYQYVKYNNIDIICFNEFNNIHYKIIKDNEFFNIYNNTYECNDNFISSGNIIFYKNTLNLVKQLHKNIICINDLYILSYRGPSGNNYKKKRIEEITKIIEYSNNKKIILLGDTNARKNDYDEINIEKYFNDCWKLKGNKSNEYTVDNYNNTYFINGYKYRSRYDRAYITTDIKLLDFNIIFKEKYDDLKKYNGSGCISDHYGVYLSMIY